MRLTGKHSIFLRRLLLAGHRARPDVGHLPVEPSSGLPQPSEVRPLRRRQGPSSSWRRVSTADWTDVVHLPPRRSSGRFEDAERDCSRSIELDGGNSKAWFRRAVARRELADFEAAARGPCVLPRCSVASSHAVDRLDSGRMLTLASRGDKRPLPGCQTRQQAGRAGRARDGQAARRAEGLYRAQGQGTGRDEWAGDWAGARTA